MASKNISITEDVYLELSRLKLPKESFSEVISRLIHSASKDPLRYFGILKNYPEEIINDFTDAIDEMKSEGLKLQSKKLIENWEIEGNSK